MSRECGEVHTRASNAAHFCRIFDRCTAVVSEHAKGHARRRLAAILFAGYSRLFAGDEKEDFAELRAFGAKVIEPLILELGGNIFKETAELALAEFDNGVKAARCAAALRDAVAQMNRTLPDEQRIAMRIGINFGDVIIQDGDIFGDEHRRASRGAGPARHSL